MKYRLLVVGKPRTQWANEASAEYQKRIGGFGTMEEVHIKAEPYRKSNAERVRRIESERIMQAHRKGDLLVVLDERGEALDTLGFSKLIDEGRQRGSVAFAIGGPYGHDPALRKQAWKVVRLSSLVLNHDLARVVVYEQLYRALTILHGVPYHH